MKITFSHSLTLLLIFLITLSTNLSFAARKPINPCINNMENEIGTLYLCGYGGKFKVLSLSRCHLQDADMPAVATFLAEHPRINALDLGENNLTGEGMSALTTNKTLAWLSVSYNRIGDQGAVYIANITSLTNLDLVASGIGSEGGKALANMSLKALDISRNSIKSEGGMALAKNTTLHILSLDENFIGPEAASAFAGNTSIAYLYMGWNYIDDTAAVLLAKNTNLTELGLEYNNIGNAGAFAFAENTSLQWLYLHRNHIGPAGIAALENNKYFVEVTTDDNDGTVLARKSKKSIPRRQYFANTAAIRACR